MNIRKLLFALFIILSGQLSAQVKFAPRFFENGFKYPFARMADRKIEDTINSQIHSRISDLEASDFCIGDYGYVQKGKLLQIHMLCTCIDLDESEHRYLFLNLETGLSVPQSHLFASDQRERALAFISNAIINHSTSVVECSEAYSSLPEKIIFNDINIRIAKDGIEVRPANSNACEQGALKIEWNKIHSYLQHSFI